MSLKKKEQELHATILCLYYAQNVKVNLGHNFQIKKRGREKREREREREKCSKDTV